jgi:hypothetical protein
MAKTKRLAVVQPPDEFVRQPSQVKARVWANVLFVWISSNYYPLQLDY